jgi:hypothetical protein
MSKQIDFGEPTTASKASRLGANHDVFDSYITYIYILQRHSKLVIHFYTTINAQFGKLATNFRLTVPTKTVRKRLILPQRCYFSTSIYSGNNAYLSSNHTATGLVGSSTDFGFRVAERVVGI